MVTKLFSLVKEINISYSLFIRLLLLQQGIHPNPGPENIMSRPSGITTLNVRGTGQRGKLRTILTTFRPSIAKGHIACLQETHSIDKRYLDKVWQMGKVVANGTGRSCGVIILYNNDTFEAVSTETDIDGRYIIAILKDKKSDRLLLLTNIYAPNDFNESITFFNTVFDKIEGLKEAHVDENGLNANLEICLVGDFNFVVDETQCYKRLHTIQEKRLSRLVSNRLDTLSLIDTIGFDTDVAKHTWTARGICSRLDRTYCDQNLYNKIFALNKSWGVTKSDHASVSILYNQATYSRGPGIKGLKTVYLKNETFTSNIRQELQAWVENTPEAWDPHQKWEYCKVGLYTVASKQGTKYTSLQHVRKAELIKELTKLKLSIANESRPRFISITNQKIAALEYELNDIHEIEAESLFLQSGVKWIRRRAFQ
jgi:exonuclease III